MSYREPDFQNEIALVMGIHYANTNRTAELATITAALASDTTTHDATMETPAAALQPGLATHTRFTNDILLVVNEGKGGNLTNSQMIAAIDAVAGVASAPGLIDIPYASANASPPIVGTVCSVTNGNWVGTPTSYTYQWKRDGTNIGGATSATYTLVSADTGGHQITCVVTATNATGSTAAPPSNAIAVP
jgi:hypothetical protein